MGNKEFCYFVKMKDQEPGEYLTVSPLGQVRGDHAVSLSVGRAWVGNTSQ